ncbi:hypothetical protein pb186bvf_005109 [Paramecium bursaria]
MFYICCMIIEILLPLRQALIYTTVNSCTNEKNILKLDIRQKVSQLINGTIEDLDSYAICQDAYQYDYIWLYQLWTPSKFNFIYINGYPQKTNDYRELENIKEYLIDPTIGSLTNLYKFQVNVRKYCPHIKFLGEFSFYVPKDSYLTQNKTRFFKRPMYDNPNIYSDRYDDENFIWAFNDQMKTVPYALPWNYFTTAGIADMQYIIYGMMSQHQLDGVVFLQPSLGLYQKFTSQIYSTEIQDQANPKLLTDFYDQMGLQTKFTPKIFIGGNDRLNLKSQLLNYLQQIYGQPTINDWANINFTWSPTERHTQNVIVDPKTMRATAANVKYANINENMSLIQNNCIRFNWTQYYSSQGGGAVGINTNGQGPMLIYSGKRVALADEDQSFNFGTGDMIEVQFEPLTSVARYKKYFVENSQQTSMIVSDLNQSLLKFSILLVQNGAAINIAFPFQYSQTLKNSNLVIQGHRHMSQTQSLSQQYYYIAQVEPSINQIVDDFNLNFLIVSLESNQYLGIGLCNREVVQLQNHQHKGTDLGGGIYMLFSQGYIWHNSSSTLNNIKKNQSYAQGNLISVTFFKSNNSILYYKDHTFMYSLPVTDIVKNLNFCVAMNSQYSTISLEY